MKDPLITVVTVTKDNLSGLRETEVSLRSQTDRGFEWLVIDGASSDGTEEFLSRLEMEKTRFWVEEDESQFEAMNKGIERSSGEYLLFLNAGDTLHDPEVIAKVSQEQQGEDWLIGDAVDLVGDEVRIYKQARSLNYLRHSLPSSHQAIFFRKGAVGEVRYKGDEYPVSGDYAFAVEIYNAGRRSARYLGIPICEFRLGGLSTQNRARLLRDVWNAQRDILGLGLPFRVVSYLYRLISMFLLDNFSRQYSVLRSWADRFTRASQ